MNKYKCIIKRSELLEAIVSAENEEEAEKGAAKAFVAEEYTNTGEQEVAISSIKQIFQ